LGLETLDWSLAGGAVDSHIGYTIPPVVGLGLKVPKILERSQRPEVVLNVMDSAFFHFSFFMGAAGVAGPGDNGQGPEKVEKGPVEADDRPDPLGHGGEHVIRDQFFWGAFEEPEGIHQAAVKTLLPLGVRELQVQESTMGFDDGQTVEFSLCLPVSH
jgi:hypothetical protein